MHWTPVSEVAPTVENGSSVGLSVVLHFQRL